MGRATALWGIGRPQEALATAREAVSPYRRLARVDAAYRPQLADALNLLGVVLSRLGLHAEARPVAGRCATTGVGRCGAPRRR